MTERQQQVEALRPQVVEKLMADNGIGHMEASWLCAAFEKFVHDFHPDQQNKFSAFMHGFFAHKAMSDFLNPTQRN